MASSAQPDSSLALAEAARRSQLLLRGDLLRDVTRTWTLLDFQRLGATWPTWLQVMMAILRRYHTDSTESGALYYRAARQAATGDAGDGSLVRLADPPAEEWLMRALGYAAPGAYARQVAAGEDVEAAIKAAQVQTLGTASRIMLDGARTTILDTSKADHASVGYYRVTDGDPCAFCALLASRGVVYRASTADFKAHNDCGCFGAPAFSKDQALPAISREASRVYRQRGSGDAMVAFRKAWRNRAA